MMDYCEKCKHRFCPDPEEDINFRTYECMKDVYDLDIEDLEICPEFTPKPQTNRHKSILNS